MSATQDESATLHCPPFHKPFPRAKAPPSNMDKQLWGREKKVWFQNGVLRAGLEEVTRHRIE